MGGGGGQRGKAGREKRLSEPLWISGSSFSDLFIKQKKEASFHPRACKHTPPPKKIRALTGVKNHEALVDSDLRCGESDSLRRVHELSNEKTKRKGAKTKSARQS